jgi:hypothetical protein
MSTSVASDLETPRPSRGRGAEKAAILAAKLLVTVACFWYISRQIEWGQVLSAIPQLDFRWAGLATVVAMLEIPLLGLRWRNIVDVLVAPSQRVTRPAMIAATAVDMFLRPARFWARLTLKLVPARPLCHVGDYGSHASSLVHLFDVSALRLRGEPGSPERREGRSGAARSARSFRTRWAGGQHGDSVCGH